MNTPQDLYRAVQSGVSAKAFLLDLYRRNTGGIPLDEIKREIWQQETQMIPAIPKSPPLTTEKLASTILPKGIQIDQEGRYCLKVRDLGAHTLEIVDAAVERFKKLTGVYPDEIIPCPSRYVLLKFKDFAPMGAHPIPYSRNFVFPVDYDVLVRRRRKEDDKWLI